MIGKFVGVAGSVALAIGIVSFGHHTQMVAHAQNQEWDYHDECINGTSCDVEENSEYYWNGDYREEVMNERGTNSKEEMMELASAPGFSAQYPGAAQSNCRTMLTTLSQLGWYIANPTCNLLGLGY